METGTYVYMWCNSFSKWLNVVPIVNDIIIPTTVLVVNAQTYRLVLQIFVK